MPKNRHSGENRNPEISTLYKNTGHRFSPVWRLLTRASNLMNSSKVQKPSFRRKPESIS